MQSIRYLVAHNDGKNFNTYDISELLVCGYCRELRSPADVGLETLSYVCPSCCQILGNLDARDQACRCSICFGCPQCLLPLRFIQQGANPSFVLSGSWMMDFAKTRTVPPGLENGSRIFELICTSCLWRSSDIALVSTSISTLLENAKELELRPDGALNSLSAANVLIKTLKPKYTDLTKQHELAEQPQSARLPQTKKAAEKKTVPADLQALAFSTILRSPLSDAKYNAALEAGQTPLCIAAQAAVLQKLTHGKGAREAQKGSTALDKRTNLLEKTWNIRAFNTLVMAYTTNLLYMGLSARMKNLYVTPHLLSDSDLRRITTDSYVPKNTSALDILHGIAKGPRQMNMDKMNNLLTDDACETLGFNDWNVAHMMLKPPIYPTNVDEIKLQRMRLIGRRSRRCLKCDRVLTRGFADRNADSAARSYIPRMLLVRSFTRRDFSVDAHSEPKTAHDYHFSDAEQTLRTVEEQRFSKASKREEDIVWCVVNFQNLRNDEVVLRMLTDQEKSDVPTEEAVKLSDERSSLKMESVAILEMNFQFFDSKLRRVEMKGKPTSDADSGKEQNLFDLVNSAASNYTVYQYIKKNMHLQEVVEFLGKIEEKGAFIVASNDTMVCAAIPLGIKEGTKAGQIGKCVLPGFVKINERSIRFIAEVELCEIGD
eukprot:Gregarina_sp_Poly_1__2443@NODE_1659_length_3606_cov_152_955355_g1054_i1_p1_GENE_NODE_1659_length_3606_cov_152_955355_g1054_i1NODE_1659_length_3606_cov_152_955355_g1054_i1_p1_ORF_typecomplete_len658_score104_95Dynactin_p62/PF05502_13/7_1e19_NODE_1659_length_3606_cov_152_955355_g1054_i15022475